MTSKRLHLLLAVGLVACQSPPESRVPGAGEAASETDVWQRARLRGVSFRAVGQEPGWLLEITEGTEILLVTDYGSKRSSLPYVEPLVTPEARRMSYALEAHDTVVEIRGEPCRDVMSGEAFPIAVLIRQPGRELEGCGRALARSWPW